MIILIPKSFLFGIPDPLPEIQGFNVIAKRDAFLHVERKGQTYLVEEFRGHFVLTPRCPGPRDWYDFRLSFWVEKPGKSTTLVPYDPVFAAWNSKLTKG